MVIYKDNGKGGRDAINVTLGDDGTFELDGKKIGYGKDGKFYELTDQEGNWQFDASKNGWFKHDNAAQQWVQDHPNLAYNGTVAKDSWEGVHTTTDNKGVVYNGANQIQWDQSANPRDYKRALRDERRYNYLARRAANRQDFRIGKLTWAKMREFNTNEWKRNYGRQPEGQQNQLEADNARAKAYKAKYRAEGLKAAQTRNATVPQEGPTQFPTQTTATNDNQNSQSTIQQSTAALRPFDPNAPTFRFGGKLSYFDYLQM